MREMAPDAVTYEAGGNPYCASVTANGQPIPDEANQTIKYQARRLVLFAEKLAR